MANTSALKALPAIRNTLQPLIKLTGRRKKHLLHLDGEVVGSSVFWAFDFLQDGVSLTDKPFSQRRELLEQFFSMWHSVYPGNKTVVRLLPCAKDAGSKRKLVRTLIRKGGEGVIIKNVQAHYHQGRRVSHSLKLKFTDTVDCVVTARNQDRESNAVLALYNDRQQLVEIGRCSMIGKPPAKVGDVVEVKYLGFVDRIVQPRLLRLRPDKDKQDCTFDQLRRTSKEVITL